MVVDDLLVEDVGLVAVMVMMVVMVAVDLDVHGVSRVRAVVDRKWELMVPVPSAFFRSQGAPTMAPEMGITV